jgi:hypothetical protein
VSPRPWRIITPTMSTMRPMSRTPPNVSSSMGPV